LLVLVLNLFFQQGDSAEKVSVLIVNSLRIVVRQAACERQHDKQNCQHQRCYSNHASFFRNVLKETLGYKISKQPGFSAYAFREMNSPQQSVCMNAKKRRKASLTIKRRS
jgi:hypothetical protein